MNFPSTPNKAAYHSAKDRIIEGSESCFAEVRSKSIEAVQSSYKDIGVTPDEKGILDIAVSYDGSWQKRGHSLHNGVGVVIDLLTGLPIDFAVLCNFCNQCLKAPPKDDPSYNNWLEEHKKSAQRISKDHQIPWNKVVPRFFGKDPLKDTSCGTQQCYQMEIVSHLTVWWKVKFMVQIFL